METTTNREDTMNANDRMKADREAARTAEYEARLEAIRRGEHGEVARQIVAQSDAARTA
jgi:hypothetical protein